MAKGKCKYCGIESGNIKMHERYCEKNPSKEVATPPPQPAQPSLTVRISNLQDILDSGMRAWFNIQNEGKVPLIPLKCGIVSISDPSTKASEEFVSVLVLTVNGTLLPPSMIAGFIGIFPEDMIFPEQAEEQPTEHPIRQVVEPEPKPVSIPETKTEPTPEIAKTLEAEANLKAFAEQPTPEAPKEKKEGKAGVGETLKGLLKKK